MLQSDWLLKCKDIEIMTHDVLQVRIRQFLTRKSPREEARAYHIIDVCPTQRALGMLKFRAT